MSSCVWAEEPGVDLGQKKDSYFYSCCHNNWCWAAGRKQRRPHSLCWGQTGFTGRLSDTFALDLVSKCQKEKKKRNQTELFITCEIGLFLLCHKELRAARLHGRGCSMAATATGWRGVQKKKKHTSHPSPCYVPCFIPTSAGHVCELDFTLE